MGEDKKYKPLGFPARKQVNKELLKEIFKQKNILLYSIDPEKDTNKINYPLSARINNIYDRKLIFPRMSFEYIDPFYLVKAISQVPQILPNNTIGPFEGIDDMFWISSIQRNEITWEYLKFKFPEKTEKIWNFIKDDYINANANTRPYKNFVQEDYEKAENLPLEDITFEMLDKFDRFWCRQRISSRIEGLALRLEKKVIKTDYIKREKYPNTEFSTYTSLNQEIIVPSIFDPDYK